MIGTAGKQLVSTKLMIDWLTVGFGLKILKNKSSIAFVPYLNLTKLSRTNTLILCMVQQEAIIIH